MSVTLPRRNHHLLWSIKYLGMGWRILYFVEYFIANFCHRWWFLRVGATDCDHYRWQYVVIEATNSPVVVNDACQYYSWCCLRVRPRSSACEHNFSARNQRSSHISHIKTSIQLPGRYVAYFFLVWGNPHIWSHIFDPSWKNFQLYSQKVDFFFNFSGICICTYCTCTYNTV